MFWAKQSCATQSYEAALVVALNDLAAARHVVPLTAVDPGGALPDPRPRHATGDGTVDDWCRVVAAGAHLQLEVARYVRRLVDVGLTVLAPADCPGYVEHQLDAFARLPAEDPPGATPDRHDAVRAALPQVTGWAEEVRCPGPAP